jgi:uncharacterized protein YktA (UPF0223 family)
MNILCLTFYFDPDLSAGSFRSTVLIKSLSQRLSNSDTIDIVTTQPNRYKTYKKHAMSFEKRDNIQIYRVKVPEHTNGFIDQINSFKSYFFDAKRIVKNKKYDLIFASSSRLFTAYLGYIIAHKRGIPLYLDIRDIFVDTMEDVLKNSIIKIFALPVIKFIEQKTFDNAAHINLISGGFLPYFTKFRCNSYSVFTNGIDSNFLNISVPEKKIKNISDVKIIVYAGNIGEGQGLEKVVPKAADILGNEYKFIIIGDGGTRTLLQKEIIKKQLTNVEIRDPVDREELMKIYAEAHYLFLHLNNYKAFEKVIPSKIFEYAVYDKPIIAGVSGYPFQFIKDNIPNVILFKPCDVLGFVEQLKKYNYKNIRRNEFMEKFARVKINAGMNDSLLRLVHAPPPARRILVRKI